MDQSQEAMARMVIDSALGQLSSSQNRDSAARPDDSWRTNAVQNQAAESRENEPPKTKNDPPKINIHAVNKHITPHIGGGLPLRHRIPVQVKAERESDLPSLHSVPAWQPDVIRQVPDMKQKQERVMPAYQAFLGQSAQFDDNYGMTPGGRYTIIGQMVEHMLAPQIKQEDGRLREITSRDYGSVIFQSQVAQLQGTGQPSQGALQGNEQPTWDAAGAGDSNASQSSQTSFEWEAPQEPRVSSPPIKREESASPKVIFSLKLEDLIEPSQAAAVPSRSLACGLATSRYASNPPQRQLVSQGIKKENKPTGQANKSMQTGYGTTLADPSVFMSAPTGANADRRRSNQAQPSLSSPAVKKEDGSSQETSKASLQHPNSNTILGENKAATVTASSGNIFQSQSGWPQFPSQVQPSRSSPAVKKEYSAPKEPTPSRLKYLNNDAMLAESWAAAVTTKTFGNRLQSLSGRPQFPSDEKLGGAARWGAWGANESADGATATATQAKSTSAEPSTSSHHETTYFTSGDGAVPRRDADLPVPVGGPRHENFSESPICKPDTPTPAESTRTTRPPIDTAIHIPVIDPHYQNFSESPRPTRYTAAAKHFSAPYYQNIIKSSTRKQDTRNPTKSTLVFRPPMYRDPVEPVINPHYQNFNEIPRPQKYTRDSPPHQTVPAKPLSIFVNADKIKIKALQKQIEEQGSKLETVEQELAAYKKEQAKSENTKKALEHQLEEQGSRLETVEQELEAYKEERLELDSMLEAFKAESEYTKDLRARFKRLEAENKDLKATKAAASATPVDAQLEWFDQRVRELELERDLKEPLFRIGKDIRTRYLEQARETILGIPRKQLDKAAIERGNVAAHNGLSEADAALLNGGFLSNDKLRLLMPVFKELYTDDPRDFYKLPAKLRGAMDCQATIRTLITLNSGMDRPLNERQRALDESRIVATKYLGMTYEEFEADVDVERRINLLKELTTVIVQYDRSNKKKASKEKANTSY